MNIITVDDERLALQLLTDTVRSVLPEAEVTPFQKTGEALGWAGTHRCDVAFLDIQMRAMTGLELARRLKELQPQINIIFVTGYDEYAGEAMKMHASGYIQKPVTEERVRREVEDLRHPVLAAEPQALLRVTCFGSFAVYKPDGTPLHFERAKAKECFAYLVSRCGAACTTRELAGILFEDTPYSGNQAAYMRMILSSMLKTLREAGAASVIRKERNLVAVVPRYLDCDYYRFRSGEITAVNRYQGEFLMQYSWAESITGYLDRNMQLKE